MPREFNRTQRIADQMQRELARILQLEMKDPRLGMVTVSSVTVSGDIAFADVYVTFLGVDGQKAIDDAVDVLRQASGFLRSMLAKRMRMRFVPTLRFHYDETIERGSYISSLIDRAIAHDSKKQKNSTEEVFDEKT
ncbi:MAG: 30S ribosome-binding factor RbfA [Endozoicomonadaceae bacterium]|nr:30S ribosome-binding factor RbfA [Endozoicomonadaceae bacterium]